MEVLYVLIAAVLIATPVFAILAFAGLRRIEKSLGDLPIQTLVTRVYALEQKLATLEAKFAAASSDQLHRETSHAPASHPEVAHPSIPTQPPSPATPQVAPPPPPQVPRHSSQVEPVNSASPSAPIDRIQALADAARASQPAKSSAPVDMEALIGGSWLNRIGIVALIAAVSFFLKYAFDNNWIGPRGRVGIGILLGAAMLPWSHWLLSRGYAYFSEGIAALGAAVLYLSVWAGWQYYALFSQSAAFASMAAVTVVMAGVALGRDSQRLAILSLLGGFLTPAILGTGKDQIVLFAYLLLLGVALMVIAARRDWRWLAPLAFTLSQIYFWSWYEVFYRVERLERTLAFATLYFLLYAAVPLMRAIRLSRLAEIDVIVILANAFVYLCALYAMLWPAYRWPLTLLVLALSAAHFIVSRLIPLPKPGEPQLPRLLFAGLAVTFATLAIPMRLEGKWITLAFAVEGAILVWTGFRSLTLFWRQAGYVLLAIAGFRVLALPLPAQTFLFNQRFGAYLALIVCLGVALMGAREYLDSVGEGEKHFLAVLAVAMNVYALISLSFELWDYFGRNASLEMDRGLAQHLALSLLWTTYATLLIVIGVRRGSALLRWQALALFLLVVMKVFLYDSSYLERFYRILSFFILGVVLLVVSFLYQRRASRERPAS